MSNDIFYFRTVIIGGPTAISMVSGVVEIRLIWFVLGEEKTSALVKRVFHVFTVYVLMCLTGEMDVTQNMKDTVNKLVCLLSFTKNIVHT